MNATTYINNAHKALSRNPGGLTLEELSGKLRAKALKVSQQIRELHDAGLIETTEDAGQPVYRLIAAPAAESAESGRDDSSLPTKTYSPAVLQAMISDLSGDSEGGEMDAPAVDAQREEFTLLGLIADIRAAAGDPSGRLMQDELVQHIAGVVKERDDLRERLDAQIKQWQSDTGELAKKARRLTADLDDMTRERDLLKAENLALKTLEGSMPGFGAEHQEQRINSLTTDVINTRNALTNAINDADRLRAELATERQAREALQEQAGVIQAAGYVLKAPKRPLRRFGKEEAAKLAAMAAARVSGRGEVFALVPVGAARRGAEWRGA